MPLVDLARTILHVMPQVFPLLEHDPNHVYAVLANFTIHVNVSVATEATLALQRIAEQCPKRRASLLLALSAFVLSISDRLPRVQQQALALYVHCLRTYQSVETQPLPASDGIVLDDAERVALLFCCSTSADVRLLALEILRIVASIPVQVGVPAALRTASVGWAELIAGGSVAPVGAHARVGAVTAHARRLGRAGVARRGAHRLHEQPPERRQRAQLGAAGRPPVHVAERQQQHRDDDGPDGLVARPVARRAHDTGHHVALRSALAAAGGLPAWRSGAVAAAADRVERSKCTVDARQARLRRGHGGAQPSVHPERLAFEPGRGHGAVDLRAAPARHDAF